MSYKLECQVSDCKLISICNPLTTKGSSECLSSLQEDYRIAFAEATGGKPPALESYQDVAHLPESTPDTQRRQIANMYIEKADNLRTLAAKRRQQGQ